MCRCTSNAYPSDKNTCSYLIYLFQFLFLYLSVTFISYSNVRKQIQINSSLWKDTQLSYFYYNVSIWPHSGPGKTWDRFQVEKVVPLGETLLYSPPDTVTQAEEKDDLGLILGLTFGLLALLIISVFIVYLAWRRKWCKNRWVW